MSIGPLVGQREWPLGLSCPMKRGLSSTNMGKRAWPEVFCPAKGMPEYWFSWLVGIIVAKRAACWDLGMLIPRSPAHPMLVSILVPRSVSHPDAKRYTVKQLQNSLCILFVAPSPQLFLACGHDGTYDDEWGLGRVSQFIAC